jgi:hypothetical protein
VAHSIILLYKYQVLSLLLTSHHTAQSREPGNIMKGKWGVSLMKSRLGVTIRVGERKYGMVAPRHNTAQTEGMLAGKREYTYRNPMHT